MGALKLEFLYFPLFYKIMPPLTPFFPLAAPPPLSPRPPAMKLQPEPPTHWPGGHPGRQRNQKAGRKREGEGETGDSRNLQMETEWKKGERQSGEGMEQGRNKRVETEPTRGERSLEGKTKIQIREEGKEGRKKGQGGKNR